MPLVAQNPKHRVILGLMTFGPPGSEELDARICDSETFTKALDVFQGRGYSEIDTARIYVGGKQEAWTRQVGWQERGFTLATKVKYPRDPGDNTAEKVVESVETSLKELGTDCIDVSLPSLSEVSLSDTTISCSTSTVLIVVSPLQRRWRPSISSTRQASLFDSASATLRRMKLQRLS